MDPAPALSLLPKALRERYQAKRLLGRGGMGAVYQGRLPETGRPCAIKIVHGNPGSSAGARLIQEARLLSRVRHPNLIEVYDVGEEQGMPWLVMELVEGQDLEDIHGDEPVPLDQLERVARDVTDVLEVLHGQGILHRDIKPQNLMRDATGRTIVMDLGLARDVEATRQTATGALVGTLLFLPPEALTEDHQGPAWDWYALGMTLYVLLTGEKPYTSEQIFAMAAQGRWRPPPPLPLAVRRTPLGRTCEALLHPDPEVRPHDAAQVRAALDGQDSGEVVRRPSASVALLAPSEPPAPSGRTRSLLLGAALFAFGVGLGALWLGAPREPSGGSLPAGSEAGAPPGVPRELSPEAAFAGEVTPGGERSPQLALAALVRGEDRARARRVHEGLGEIPDLALRDYLTFRLLETEGDHDGLRDLFDAMEVPGPLESYLQARLAAEALGHRLVVEGPYAPAPSPQKQARLKQNLHQLDRALAERDEPWAAWARVELWDILSRRVQVRPRVNLPALQVARELGDALAPTLAEARGLQGVSALLAYTRVLSRLGEVERGRAVLEAYEPGLLDPVAADDVLDFWREELRFELKGHQLPAGGGLFSAARLFKPSFEVDWLPAVEGRRGLAPRGTPADPPVVRDPPEGPTLMVAESGDPIRALVEARREALVRGGEVRTTIAWRARHLTAEALKQDLELRRLVIRQLEVLAALVPSMQEAGEHELLLELHREADRSRRNTAGYFWENRAHFVGRPAAMVRRFVDLELRFGDLGRGMDRARTRLDHFRQLNPPYTLEEMRHISNLWRLLDGRLNRNGPCTDFRDEGLRVGLHYLEALARLRPGRQATTATREDWKLKVAEQASHWAYHHDRDMTVDHISRRAMNEAMSRAMARLGPDASSIWTQQELTVRGERTRRTLSRDHGCPDGWVEANRSPPEVVFGAPEGTLRERFLAVLAGL